VVELGPALVAALPAAEAWHRAFPLLEVVQVVVEQAVA
jgi:hypothetical protein